ncbi:MAG: transporter substrate-binding domain-containing protein, partial [Clostridia bacterium]|nr:transporter substrate-binding domain-containing protein [Clostridia bacterium]
MKKFARLLALVIACISVLTMAACSQEDDSEVYVIYSDKNYAPFEFYDKDSEAYIGIDMDLLAAIAEDQGFKYEVKNDTFNAAQGAVQAGQADAMIAGMTITEKRKATFDFSDGYFEDGIVLVVGKEYEFKSLEDLSGQVVA